MNTKKFQAIFVENDTGEVYALSLSNRAILEKKHPNWVNYNCESNYEDLQDVYQFFKKYGVLIAHPRFQNSFIGIIV